MNTGMFQLLAVSAVVMGIAQTVSREKIFAPLRERCGGKETWLGYLVSCPYCASHYIAFAVVPLTGSYFVRVPYEWGFVDDVLTWFFSSILVVVVAAFMRVLFWFVDESQGLVKRQQKIADAEVEIKNHELEEEVRIH